MDQRLLNYYNRELTYLRELGGEFAKQFPKIAGRLGLDAFECTDPYTERLLEGFAFLAARVQLKIDAEFPRFTEHLLSMVYPQYLSPTPSMVVVKIKPNFRQGSFEGGVLIPRGTALSSNPVRGDQTTCEYRTGHDVRLWPIELVSVTHSAYLADFSGLATLGQKPIRGAVRFKFQTLGGLSANQLALDALPLYVNGPDRLAVSLCELLLAGTQALLVRPKAGAPTNTGQLLTRRPVRHAGFDDDEALLPTSAKSFQGYRLLQEYFTLPRRYSFVELSNLRQALASCSGQEFELIALLDRYDPNIEVAVSNANFDLFCTPAVNLFPKRADRIHLNERVNHYHVVMDRTRPLDFELHSLSEVIGYGAGSERRRDFRPFYACREREREHSGAYYSLHREAHVQSARSRRNGPRSTYAGSEAFITLVDGNNGPFVSDLRQLGLQGLCTNRDLPLRMSLGQGSTDFTIEAGAPIESVRVLAGPSEPREAAAWGATSWRLISHLSLNYLSLLDDEHGQGASSLRELLRLYGDNAATALKRQIDGIESVASSGIVRRIPGAGPASFARGIEITLRCDETAFEGAGPFLFGAVLERFFAKYTAINSFTETVLRTSQRGEVMRWPARAGGRVLL